MKVVKILLTGLLLMLSKTAISQVVEKIYSDDIIDIDYTVSRDTSLPPGMYKVGVIFSQRKTPFLMFGLPVAAVSTTNLWVNEAQNVFMPIMRQCEKYALIYNSAPEKYSFRVTGTMVAGNGSDVFYVYDTTKNKSISCALIKK